MNHGKNIWPLEWPMFTMTHPHPSTLLTIGMALALLRQAETRSPKYPWVHIS